MKHGQKYEHSHDGPPQNPRRHIILHGANAKLLREFPLGWQFLLWLFMSKCFGGDSRDASWGSAVANLSPKLASAKNPDKFRAIALDAITL